MAAFDVDVVVEQVADIVGPWGREEAPAGAAGRARAPGAAAYIGSSRSAFFNLPKVDKELARVASARLGSGWLDARNAAGGLTPRVAASPRPLIGR